MRDIGKRGTSMHGVVLARFALVEPTLSPHYSARGFIVLVAEGVRSAAQPTAACDHDGTRSVVLVLCGVSGGVRKKHRVNVSLA